MNDHNSVDVLDRFKYCCLFLWVSLLVGLFAKKSMSVTKRQEREREDTFCSFENVVSQKGGLTAEWFLSALSFSMDSPLIVVLFAKRIIQLAPGT